VAIQLPIQVNAYTDPGKFVGKIEDVAQNYLIEQGIEGVVPTDQFNFIGFGENILLVENLGKKQGYMIENGGQVSSFDIESNTPVSDADISTDTSNTPSAYVPPDVFIEEITEPD
jgi:hypothetical protein